MPADQDPILDCQAAFMRAWRGVGLQIAVPLVFEDKDEDPVLPSAIGRLREVGSWQYSIGRTVRMQIDIEVRLVQGYKQRRSIACLIEEITNRGKRLAGVTELLPKGGQLQTDPKRFAGKQIELIPYAWEMWYDIERK